MGDNDQHKAGLWERLMQNIEYCIHGVWNDLRDRRTVKAVKIINLTIRSFLDRDLQMRSCALTYNTVLAVVPALAMLFAIARGFGFQNLLQSELFRYFPAQQQALETALTYVDNYLAQASQGIFIGIGLVFLLWTLISLMSNVEDTFNHVWGLKTNRSLRRKFTDYTALFLLLPLLMVCSAGISIFMSDAVQHVLADNPLSPMVHRLLAFMPTVISWLVFTAAYYLIPNTKVSFKGALFAGVLCGTLFQAVQWLFVTGQVYVSKYNAIYGSFAFLPLLLVWLQLSWLITLAGVGLSYAWQNFDSFAHNDKAKDMSPTYAKQIAVAVIATIASRFKNQEPPLSRHELVSDYGLPGSFVDSLLDRMVKAGLINPIADKESESGELRYQPAVDPDDLTVNNVTNALADLGNTHFIPQMDSRFSELLERIDTLRDNQQAAAEDIHLLDLMPHDISVKRR